MSERETSQDRVNIKTFTLEDEEHKYANKNFKMLCQGSTPRGF